MKQFQAWLMKNQINQGIQVGQVKANVENNDILYKPFMNGNYTGQQPVYHPNVLDKIREIIE